MLPAFAEPSTVVLVHAHRPVGTVASGDIDANSSALLKHRGTGSGESQGAARVGRSLDGEGHGRLGRRQVVSIAGLGDVQVHCPWAIPVTVLPIRCNSRWISKCRSPSGRRWP